MADFDADSLAEQAVLIGLLTREQAKEARVLAEDGSAIALMKSMVRKGFLTSWQRDRLLRGDARGFFYGPYKVDFHLAEGTFARVFRGQRVDTGDPVAIKVLRRRFSTDRESVERFAAEAEACAELDHPNIVRVFDHGEADGSYYMAMQYVEGTNLRDLLKLRDRIGEKEAMPILLGLARGMKYSHHQGMTHRDIKGTNILVSNRREPKLVDFGLATIGEGRAVEFANTRTVDYSALERACGSHKGDWRSDIYFLGCVFYQILTGVLPFPEVESSDALAKMLKRSFGAIKPISEMRYAPSASLCDVVEKMMKLPLNQRYQMFDEVVEDLEAIAGSEADGDTDTDIEDATIHELSEADLMAEVFEGRTKPPAATGPGSKSGAKVPSTEGATESADGPKLLCVVTQETIRKAFEKSLTKMGYRIVNANDTEAATSMFFEEKPDAVIFDADGLGDEAIDALVSMHERSHEEGHPLVGLVILGPKQIDLSLSLPDDDRLIVLAKPIRMKQVQDAIAQLVPLPA